MLKRSLFPAALLFAFAPFAVAAEQANNCRLKGGAMVPLEAGVCVREGGTVVTTAAEPAVPAVPLQLSDDPKLAAAQRAVVELLMKQVMDQNPKRRTPEWIERVVKFDGCRLLVDEEMEIEHGNAWSSRKHFKVSSTVDMGKVDRAAFGELGKVRSYGGGMEAYATYVEEIRSRGNNISISVQLQRAGGYGKYSASASGSYWDASKTDLWMVDEYGYPTGSGEFSMDTDKVRLLFLMNTAEDAAALHKAFGEVHALCQH